VCRNDDEFWAVYGYNIGEHYPQSVTLLVCYSWDSCQYELKVHVYGNDRCYDGVFYSANVCDNGTVMICQEAGLCSRGRLSGRAAGRSVL